MVFFISSLGGGGAEKHLVRIANHMDGTKFRVHVVVVRGGGEYETELLDHVECRTLEAGSMLRAVVPLRRAIRDLRPEVVCSFLDRANCVAILATRTLRSRPRIVVGVQNALSMEFAKERGWPGRFLKAAVRTLYPLADHVVAISHGVQEDLYELLPRGRPPIEVIYNAGWDSTLTELAKEDGEVPPEWMRRPALLSCGRLTEQKGHEYLLRAFARIRESRNAVLWILGEGDREAELRAMAERLGIVEDVWFAGFRPNPFPYMREADVFVLSSLWEGFGNVIVEAMAVDTPVVSTDCPHGPGEILSHGETGILVPPRDAGALAAAIERLLDDPLERKRLAAAGRHRAERFRAAEIARRYGDVFDRVCSEIRVPRQSPVR